VTQEPDKKYIEEIREGEQVASAFLLDELRLGQTRAVSPLSASS
jgi:hypothetical protein